MKKHIFVGVLSLVCVSSPALAYVKPSASIDLETQNVIVGGQTIQNLTALVLSLKAQLEEVTKEYNGLLSRANPLLPMSAQLKPSKACTVLKKDFQSAQKSANDEETAWINAYDKRTHVGDRKTLAKDLEKIQADGEARTNKFLENMKMTEDRYYRLCLGVF